MTCRADTVHHAYPNEDGIAHCCLTHWTVLIDARQVLTTDPARVTCGGQG